MLFAYFRRRRPRLMVEGIVREPVDPALAATPVTVRVRYVAMIFGRFSFLIHFAFFVGVLFTLGALEFNLVLIALIVVALALGALIASLTLLKMLRALGVGGEGLRVFRLTSGELWQWSLIRDIEVSRSGDLTIVTQGGHVSKISASGADVVQLTAALKAMKAHLAPYGVELRIGPRREPLRRYATGIALEMPGLALMVITLIVEPRFAGNSLGMRCSGPSVYLQERFHQQHRPGCIAVGVTGAAKRAGLQQGDMIISLNGIPTTSGTQFGDRYNKEGHSLHLEVIREGGEPFKVTVTFGPGGSIDLPNDDPLHPYKAGLASSDHDERIQQFTKALRMDPKFELAYLRRGESYFAQERYDLALRDFNSATELDPTLAEGWQWIGWIRLQESEVPAALAAASRAIELDQCATAFTRYNVDCYYDYKLLNFIYDATGDPRAAEARHQRDEFWSGT